VERVRKRRETGSSLMFIAAVLWVSDLLVIFFLPAAVKLGKYTSFLAVVTALALVGLALFVKGYAMRRNGTAD
jgi:hypothetical protein